MRPSDTISFKQLTIEDAVTAALRTDALMAAVRGMALGELDAKAAAAKLDAFEASTWREGADWVPVGHAPALFFGPLTAGAFAMLGPALGGMTQGAS